MESEDQLSEQREQIVLRILELGVTQKKNMQKFANGEPTPLHVRAAIELELSQLYVEKHKIEVQLNTATRNRKIARRTHAHVVLVQILESMGMHDIVVQSERAATLASNQLRSQAT